MKDNTENFTKFLLRLTKDEKIIFTQLATQSGYPLTQWVRLKLKQAAIEEFKKQNRGNPFIKQKA